MLTKNRLTALLMAFLLVVALLISSLAAYEYLLGPSFPRPVTWIEYLLTVAGISVASLMIWNSPFITNLDEKEGFGCSGLIRWVACGLMAGALIGLFEGALGRWLDEKNFFRPGLETLGPVFLFSLVYWLIFRKNFWTIDKNSTPPEVTLTR
jgi:hypothetical protein